MSNRLEWREVSTQGINPNEGLRTYMDGLKNAHSATNTMRQNQRVDDQAIIENQSRLLNDALKIGAHQQSIEQQDIANNQKDRYLDLLSKGKESKAPAYDKLAFENYTTQHFEQGGTLETLANDETFRNTFDTTDPKVMEHLLATQGRYTGRLDTEYEADKKLLIERHTRNIASIPSDISPEGKKAATDQYDLELSNGIAGLDALRASGRSSRSLQLNQQLNGTAPSNRNNDGSVERPALSRVKAVDTLREAVISETDQRKAELDKQLEEGMDLEDYNSQVSMLESYRDTNLKQIDDDANKANIKSFTGATVGVDYSISSSGSLVVGGKNVPERVGNALRQAAELTGQPLDIILPFASTESAFNPNAVSQTGVKGLMQVTGDTADEVYARNKDVFARAGLTYDPKDRTNPETSALLGALYIGEIRQKLGNDAPMEMVYMAYNLGPNDKLLDPSHNKNTPIDQLVPVSAGKISVGLKNNKAVYQNKDGTWKTLNQAAEEIRRRAGVSDIVLSDPAATIEQKATAENIANNIKVRGESALVNFSPADLADRTNSSISTISDLISPFSRTTSKEGTDVKPASDLTNEDITTMLAAADIKDVSKATAGKLYTKINKDPTLKDLNSDQIGMLLSYTPKGNFTQDIDEVGLDRNIAIIKGVWEANKTAVKANMDDAISVKKIITDFQTKVEPLKNDILNSERVIAETGLKLKDESLLSEYQIRAYTLDIKTHEKKLEENKKALSFHSNFTAERINPLLDNIAKFNKTMEDTYANEEARLAQVAIDKIASDPYTGEARLDDILEVGVASTKFNPVLHRSARYLKDVSTGVQTGNPIQDFNKFREEVERKASEKKKDQFTGNPFKDYATNKRLAESKNK